ncbi:MAG TPA: MraY family glycosyltransferase [Longimicrobiales bacterium]|nr:MraY family glycosyltransferase [Longimicrobiales bacterium]
MNPTLLAATVAGLALVLTAVLTPLVRGAAIAGGMVRQIRTDRWHRRPTPAIGGVAIYLGFGLSVGAGYLLDPDTALGLGRRLPQAFLPLNTWEGLVLAATMAFVVGLVDDFVHLGPRTKLLGQVVAAGILLGSGIGVWLTGVYLLDAALSLLWFVGLTNAMNLLDNMDGLAAGVAAIAGMYLTVLFYLSGEMGLVLLALAFTASLIGFLAHNYPPARIFMGDSGSLFLGLFLAGLALAPAPGLSRSLAAVLAVPVLILGVPILDTTLVTLGRLLEGRPVSQGGKDHTSHRFIDLGMPEKQTLWMLWTLAAVGGGVGLMLRSAQRGTALLLGGLMIGMLTLMGAYLLAVRFRAMEAGSKPGPSLYRFLVRSQERYPVLALFLDGIWITLAYYAAYAIRWEPSELPIQLPYFRETVVVFVGVKLVALVFTGTYSSPWSTFGLYDALRVVRSSLVATLLAAGALILLARVGLSRGVVAIDFLVCSLLIVGSRFSFRVIEGTTQRWSEERTPVVILAAVADAELAVRQLARLAEPRLRAVAVADQGSGVARGRVGAIPLFGGQAALRHALQETRANAVVVVGSAGHTDLEALEALTHHLDNVGGVDAYRLEVRVERLQGKGRAV